MSIIKNQENPAVSAFNEKFPVGSRLGYRSSLRAKKVVMCEVVAPAFTSASGESVCFVTGVSGYVSTDHLVEVDEK